MTNKITKIHRKYPDQKWDFKALSKQEKYDQLEKQLLKNKNVRKITVAVERTNRKNWNKRYLD